MSAMTNTSEVLKNRIAYRSPMSKWAKQASVKHASPTIVLDEDLTGLPFSAALFPIASHPMVVERGSTQIERVLALRGDAYLTFTEVLERDCIIPVALLLANDNFKLGLGDAFASDALRVVIDEGYHAFEAKEVREAVAAKTGLIGSAARRQGCFDELDRVLAETPPELRDIVRLIFATVSETLITSVLASLPADEAVMPIIRRKVLDHAKDEALHHRMFVQVLEALWDGWSAAERDKFAPYFVRFISEFVSPRLSDYRDWLKECGFTSGESHQIVEESYAPDVIRRSIQDSASASIRAMSNVGVLEHAALADGLEEAGLWQR